MKLFSVRTIQNLLPAAILGIILLTAAPVAKADPVLYSFSVGDLLDELPPGLEVSNGYFAFFLRPIGVTSPVLLSATGPSPLWSASVMTDPAGLNATGTFFVFTKNTLAADLDPVALASRTNIFLNGAFSDAGPEPGKFGTKIGKITSFLDESAMMTVQIDALTPLPHNITFDGYASAIHSASTTSFPHPGFWGDKTTANIPLSLTATAVPEPGSTWMLLGIGLGAMGLFAKRKRTRSS